MILPPVSDSHFFTVEAGSALAPLNDARTPSMLSPFFSAASMIFSYSAGTPGIHVGMFFFMIRMTRSISGAGSSWISPPIIGAIVMFMVRP